MHVQYKHFIFALVFFFYFSIGLQFYNQLYDDYLFSQYQIFTTVFLAPLNGDTVRHMLSGFSSADWANGVTSQQLCLLSISVFTILAVVAVLTATHRDL